MRCGSAFLLGSVILSLSAATAGAAVMNRPPPTGPVVKDLDGETITHDYRPYFVQFTATSAITDLSFAFRDDSSSLFLDDVSVMMAGGPNIVTNGDFNAGPVGAAAPAGWRYLGPSLEHGGSVVDTAGPDRSNAYEDGSVGGYDAITQRLTTEIGALYTIAFQLEEVGTFSTYSALSTNGLSGHSGNGVDLLVYAGSGLPIQSVVPLPGSAPLLGAALLVFGMLGLGVRRGAAREV